MHTICDKSLLETSIFFIEKEVYSTDDIETGKYFGMV